MGNDWFSFKQFTVRQRHAAMKVGTDGVLLGAWATPSPGGRVLDVGTGTGLLALMLAQREPTLLVDAIEIEPQAARQAEENAKASPWGDRVWIGCADFTEWSQTETAARYAHIISNPPYFVSSLLSKENARNIARHDASLPQEALLRGVLRLLSPEGRLSLIMPYAEGVSFIDRAGQEGLYCYRSMNVSNKPTSAVKRLLMEFSRQALSYEEESLSIRNEDNQYSDEYRRLTADFYLDF